MFGSMQPQDSRENRTTTKFVLRPSVLTTELCLGHASTHNASGRQTTRDDVSHFVDNLRATPLLVSQSLDTIFALLSLNHLHISTHALGGEFLCKVINAQSITVEASKCAKLPAKAELSQIKDEVLHLLSVMPEPSQLKEGLL